MAGNSDFFLNFGSNAKTWASGLSGELKPATESITSLTTALERYDAATNNRKSNGPLDNLFTRLDQVSEKFSDLTGSLASTFDKAIQGMNLLREDMTQLLQSVQGVSGAAAVAKRGRRKIDAVDDADVESAAALRNRQALRVNTTAANKQLDRLAEINGRLAPRAQEAADKIINLSASIGELQGASHRAMGGLDALEAKLSRLGEGVVINAPAGVAGSGISVNPNDFGPMIEQLASAIRGMTLTFDHATIQNGRIVQQAQQVVDSAPISRVEQRQDAGKVGIFAAGDVTSVGDRYTGAPVAGPGQYPTRMIPTVLKNGRPGKPRELEVIDHRLDQPARSAWPEGSRDGSRTFALGTRAVTFKQGDLIGNETFAQMFARMEELDKRFRPVEDKLPTAAQIDPQNGAILERVSRAFRQGGGAHQRYVTRNADRMSGQHALSESISAHPTTSLFSTGSIDGIRVGSLLKRAEEAGLGMVSRRDPESGEMVQKFDQAELVKQALALTSEQYIPGKFGVQEGVVPAARGSVLRNFVIDELKANQRQTFSGLGSPELNNVRKVLDEEIVRHHEDPAARINPTLDPALREHFPEGSQQYAELVEGARSRLAADKVSGEVSTNIRAVQSARREFDQRRAVNEEARTFKEDSGLGILADRGSAPAHTDASITAERLNQQYALATQISKAKERREDTQKFLDKEIVRRASLNDPEEINKSTKNINDATSGIETTTAHIQDLEEKHRAKQKEIRDAATSAREERKRYDAIAVNAKEARKVVRQLPRDIPENLSDTDVRDVLDLSPEEQQIRVTGARKERKAKIQRQLAEAQRVMGVVEQGPEGIAKLTSGTVNEDALKKAREVQAAKKAAIDARVTQATQELLPGLERERKLREAALTREEKARATALAARTKLNEQQGLSVQEINEGVRRRKAERAANGGFSSEDLPQERKAIQARLDREALDKQLREERQAAEQTRLANLTPLQEKATADRAKKRLEQLQKGMSVADIDAETRARNAERLANGGFSSSDLPSERRAIKARLSTPEGRYEQARREQVAGVPLELPEQISEASLSTYGSMFRTSSGKERSPGAVKRDLKAIIEGYTKDLEDLSVKRTPASVTDEHRAAAVEKQAQERVSKITPLLEKFGIDPKEAATVARGSNAEIREALLAAAAKMDEAAVLQLQAADKAEAAQDRKDGFKRTPAQDRAAGRGGNEGVRFAPRLDEVGNVIEGDLTPRQQRRRAKTQRESSESVAYSDIVPGTERGPLGERLGAIDLTKMVAKLESTIGSKRTPEGRKEVLQEQLERASAALETLTKAASEAAVAEGSMVDVYRLQLKGQKPFAGSSETSGVTGRFFTDDKDFLHLDNNQIAEEYKHLSAEANQPIELLHAQLPKEVADKYRLRAYRDRNPEATAQMDIGDFDKELLIPEDELRRHRVTSTQLGKAYTQEQIEAETERAKLSNGDIDSAATAQQLLDRAGKARVLYRGTSTATERKSANIAGEAADAKAPAVPAALLAEKELLDSQHAESLARKRAANSALKKANADGTATDELRATSEASNAAHKQLNQRIAALSTQIAKEEAAVARATGAAGGGGGRPPRPPKSTGGGGTADEPSDGEKKPRPRSAAEASNDKFNNAQHLANFAQFSPDVQAAVQTAARAAGVKPGVTLTDAQKKAILPSLFQFRDDPMYGKYDAKTTRRTFAAGAGITLPGDVGNQRFLTDSFNLNKPGPGSSAIQGVRDLTRVEEALAIESVKVREALLAQIAAEERLAAVRANPNSTPGQIARAERGVSAASRQYEMAKLADANPPIGGIGKLLQSGGQQAIRFASFQIAFTGIEKVRELVDTGIQAQTQFIRLQANLEATGRSANGLMQALGDISSQTAQPLAHTIQAASELTGVLKTKGDLLEGAKIASELANISHGMLTATQAAIGLRDVTDAYGLSGVAALQGVGDMIAKVSQVTGVSVHDVIEGTTQLAQEAHSFGLSQRMAAVLAAEVTKNTGESGESAAEQVSRILSTFNNGKVQQLLAKTVVPQFNAEGQKNKDAGQTVVPQELFDQAGGIGQGLTRLLAMYDQLTPAQQHAIDALVGTGRQARALTGVLRDAATASKLLNDVQDDQGALAKQNAAFLRTLGGAVQKLGADFRNLGADLMQAHVFDILMLVVGAVDKLMTSVDALFRVFGLANDNPLTKSLLQMIILLGEVSLAFKVFGGEKAAAFGMGMAQRVGLGGFFTSVGAARTQQAEAAVASGGPTFIPFRRTRAMGTILNDTYQGRRPPVIVPGGRFVTDSAGTTEEMLGNPFIGRTAGIPAATRFATNSAGVTTEEMLGNPFTGTLAATEAEVTASKLAGLGTGIVALGKSVGGPLLAISALMYLFDQFGKAGAAAKATEAHSRSLEDEVTGKSAADRKKDAEKTHQDDILSQEDKAAKVRESTRARRGVGGFLRDVVDVPKTITRARNIFTGDTSQGATSDKFETAQANNYLKYSRELDTASATKDPRKVVAAQKAIDKEIGDGAEKLVKTAGDRDAQDRAWALLYQVKAQLDADAQKRTQTLMGIADVDQLSLQQLENIQTFTGKWSSVSNRVLRADPRAAQDDLSDTGVDPHSAIGRAAARSLTGNTLQRTEARIDLDKLELPQLDVQIAAKALGDPDRDRLIKARDAVFSNLQQQMDLADQLTISNADAFANILQKSGDLPGAQSNLQQEIATIKAAMISVGPTDSAFSGYLTQLSDKNQQVADLGVQDQVQNLTLSNARNPNSVSTAKNNAAIAALHLQATRDAANKNRADLQDTVLKPAQANLADAQKRQADFVPSGIGRPDGFVGPYINPMDAATAKDLADGVTAANVALKTAQTQVTGSAADKTAAVSAAMAAKIQADQAVTQSLQDQLVSANNLKVVMLQAAGAGTLAMDAQRLTNANQEVAFATKTFGAGSTQENNAKASALQAGIQQKQDFQDQATSTMSLRAAIQANAGDTTGAARTNLAKANSDLTFAVATWGRDSKQANDARAAAIAANANLQKEIDDALNAALDLEISMLSNRGNDSDKRQILTDKVKQAQNNLNAFTAKGGKLTSPEGQRLQANVNDARRSRIDQGAQIEIDTLEFQHATFKISASQEIAALQNILKTKQLTQDRARSIMLQIKGLQGEMQGQFNLGDIKLPSVYDVRRVMASGRAGAVAAASSIGYQDNRTINIQINGGHLDKVKAAMTDVLGTTATSRVTVAPKKGV